MGAFGSVQVGGGGNMEGYKAQGFANALILDLGSNRG